MVRVNVEGKKLADLYSWLGMDREESARLIKGWQAFYKGEVERNPDLAQSANFRFWLRDEIPIEEVFGNSEPRLMPLRYQ